MARRARVATVFARNVGCAVKPGSERALAVARNVRALAAADELPGPSDFEASRKPFGRAWVRRLGGRNLWLWYRFDALEVLLVAVTTDPPVPLDAELQRG